MFLLFPPQNTNIHAIMVVTVVVFLRFGSLWQNTILVFPTWETFGRSATYTHFWTRKRPLCFMKALQAMKVKMNYWNMCLQHKKLWQMEIRKHTWGWNAKFLCFSEKDLATAISTPKSTLINNRRWNFPSAPVVKNPSSNVRDSGLIPG